MGRSWQHHRLGIAVVLAISMVMWRWGDLLKHSSTAPSRTDLRKSRPILSNHEIFITNKTAGQSPFPPQAIDTGRGQAKRRRLQSRSTAEAYECDTSLQEILPSSQTPKVAGNSIRICVKPTLATLNRNVVMRRIQEFSFLKDDGTGQQAIIPNGREALDTLVTCQPGDRICVFSTQLQEDLFKSDGNVTGVGEAVMEFIGSSNEDSLLNPSSREGESRHLGQQNLTHTRKQSRRLQTEAVSAGSWEITITFQVQKSSITRPPTITSPLDWYKTSPILLRLSIVVAVAGCILIFCCCILRCIVQMNKDNRDEVIYVDAQEVPREIEVDPDSSFYGHAPGGENAHPSYRDDEQYEQYDEEYNDDIDQDQQELQHSEYDKEQRQPKPKPKHPFSFFSRWRNSSNNENKRGSKAHSKRERPPDPELNRRRRRQRPPKFKPPQNIDIAMGGETSSHSSLAGSLRDIMRSKQKREEDTKENKNDVGSSKQKDDTIAGKKTKKRKKEKKVTKADSKKKKKKKKATTPGGKKKKRKKVTSKNANEEATRASLRKSAEGCSSSEGPIAPPKTNESTRNTKQRGHTSASTERPSRKESRSTFEGLSNETSSLGLTAGSGLDNGRSRREKDIEVITKRTQESSEATSTECPIHTVLVHDGPSDDDLSLDVPSPAIRVSQLNLAEWVSDDEEDSP